MTRIWSWLGACSILTAGCRFVVSLDGLAGSSAPSTGEGGGGGSVGGASGAGGGGASGGIDASNEGGIVSDASAEDDRSDGSTNGPQPIYSLPAGATIRGITVYGANLYWVEGGTGRGLFRMAKDGSEAPVPLHVTSSATDVAVDATSIYWGDGFEIWQMPVTGTAFTPEVSYISLGATTTRYLTVDDQGVVYVSSAGAVIAGKPSSGPFVPYQQQVGISGIAFFAIADAGLHDVLWGHASGIRRGPATLTGGATMDVYTGTTESVQGIATDGQYMYWISDGRSIKRGTIAASSVSERCFSAPQTFGGDAGADFLIDIAVDERWLYFTWPAKNQIWRCAKD